MRLVSWNVFHGRNPADGIVDESRLSEAVTSLRADVLALQEVDRGQPRSHALDVTALTAEAMSATAWRFVPTLIGDPAGTWRAAGEADRDAERHGYGVALLSRWPVLQWHLLRLSPTPLLRLPVLLPGSRRLLWLRDEPRAVLAATVRTPHGVVTVASTHLSFLPGASASPARAALRWLRRLPGPRVLLGDLNLPGPAVRALWGRQPLVRARTYPHARPMIQLDHVLGDGELPPVRRASVHRLSVSDHAAVTVDLCPGP